jgi:hypothetical protein
MPLKDSFMKGAETVFSVFYEAVHDGKYLVIKDDGFTTYTEDEYDVKVILDKFTQDDVEHSSFYDLIQQTDSKGLILGKDLPNGVNTSNIIQIGDRRFTIVAFETDPLNVLYTLLLRDTK